MTPQTLIGGAIIIIGLTLMFYGFAGRRTESKTRTDGELVINTGNPDRDVYRIIFTSPFDELNKKDFILLKVVKVNTPDISDFSHE